MRSIITAAILLTITFSAIAEFAEILVIENTSGYCYNIPLNREENRSIIVWSTYDSPDSDGQYIKFETEDETFYLDDIIGYYFKNTTSGIEDITDNNQKDDSPIITISNDQINFSHIKDAVRGYGIAGELKTTIHPDSNGEASINLRDLNSGAWIFRTSSTTFKYLKK